MSSYKLYILSLEDNCWYVGITERDVHVRFAEHDGRGYYPPAAFCEEHPPILDEPAYWQDISGWVAAREDPNQSAMARAEELECRVTAQMMVLCGVNRVRGGGRDDLVAATPYDAADVHFVAQKLVSSLGVPYRDAALHVSRMLVAEDVGVFPDADYFERAQPEKIYLDEQWNVVCNGRAVVPGELTACNRPLTRSSAANARPRSVSSDTTDSPSDDDTVSEGSDREIGLSEDGDVGASEDELSELSASEDEEEEDSASSVDDASVVGDSASSIDDLSDGHSSAEEDFPSDVEDDLSDGASSLASSPVVSSFRWIFPWRTLIRSRSYPTL